MQVYRFSTLLVAPTPKHDAVTYDTLVVADNEVQAIAAAHTWIVNLAETVSDLASTRIMPYVNDQGTAVYKVDVEYACYATAKVNGFGHIAMEVNKEGGLRVATLHVDPKDNGMTLPYLRRSEFSQAIDI